MEIIRSDEQLARYVKEAVVVSGDSPVLLDSYLVGAIEVDVDALSDGTNVHVAGIMQHIEEAGVHSGDSACSLPPYSLPQHQIDDMIEQTKALALGLNVVGLMNIQFAIRGEEIFILEVKPTRKPYGSIRGKGNQFTNRFYRRTCNGWRTID